MVTEVKGKLKVFKERKWTILPHSIIVVYSDRIVLVEINKLKLKKMRPLIRYINDLHTMYLPTFCAVSP